MTEPLAAQSCNVGAELARVLRFGLVGLANTAVGASVVVALQAGCGLDPYTSNAGGILAGIVVGFVLNTNFVFAGKEQRGLFKRYVAAFALVFALEQLVLAALLYQNTFRVPTMAPQAVALIIYSCTYFLLCRFWVFAPHQDVKATRSEAPRTFDDHSATFSSCRAALVDRDGRRYVDFVQGLRPDFRRVRRDIAIGYALLVASTVLAATMPRLGAPAATTVVVPAILIGYWVAYLQLFLHEGAHYNLASTREASDRICNVLIGWMVGTSVARYRVVHFHHHRALGRRDDSENTYFSALDIGFLVKTFFGIRALEVVLARRRIIETKKKATARAPSATLPCGLAAHAAIFTVLWTIGGTASALAWIVGVGMVFPFLGALRQLLEHRSDHADADIRYDHHDHGAQTRLFEDGLFAATFGGAGFNRHLLHHWEPQVSYTNLPALERFLLDTPMRPIIEARRSTYAATFRALLTT